MPDRGACPDGDPSEIFASARSDRFGRGRDRRTRRPVDLATRGPSRCDIRPPAAWPAQSRGCAGPRRAAGIPLRIRSLEVRVLSGALASPQVRAGSLVLEGPALDRFRSMSAMASAMEPCGGHSLARDRCSTSTTTSSTTTSRTTSSTTTRCCSRCCTSSWTRSRVSTSGSSREPDAATRLFARGSIGDVSRGCWTHWDHACDRGRGCSVPGV